MEIENIDTFNPSSCISAKMTGLNRIIASIFRKYISPFGVTNSQLTLLFILSKKEGLNQKSLSDMIYLEKSSLNRNLQRLLEEKLLTKAKFPIISITDKGKIAVNKIIPEWQKAMNEIEELMEDSGKKALDTLLNNVAKNSKK